MPTITRCQVYLKAYCPCSPDCNNYTRCQLETCTNCTFYLESYDYFLTDYSEHTLSAENFLKTPKNAVLVEAGSQLSKL